jgi:hypothetical protein
MTAGKYRAVPPAEKYAELAAKGEERPNCECHGMPQYWRARTDAIAGGGWRCAEKNREVSRKWREANPEKKAELDRDYEQTPAGLMTRIRSKARKRARAAGYDPKELGL